MVKSEIIFLKEHPFKAGFGIFFLYFLFASITINIPGLDSSSVVYQPFLVTIFKEFGVLAFPMILFKYFLYSVFLSLIFKYFHKNIYFTGGLTFLVLMTFTGIQRIEYLKGSTEGERVLEIHKWVDAEASFILDNNKEDNISDMRKAPTYFEVNCTNDSLSVSGDGTISFVEPMQFGSSPSNVYYMCEFDVPLETETTEDNKVYECMYTYSLGMRSYFCFKEDEVKYLNVNPQKPINIQEIKNSYNINSRIVEKDYTDLDYKYYEGRFKKVVPTSKWYFFLPWGW